MQKRLLLFVFCGTLMGSLVGCGCNQDEDPEKVQAKDYITGKLPPKGDIKGAVKKGNSGGAMADE